MATPQLAAEDIADWLTPSGALDLLGSVFKERFVSKRALLNRLTAGMARSVCEHAVFQNGREWRPQFYALSPDDWRRIETDDMFWITGDLIFSRRSSSGIGNERCSFFGIKFHPEDVRDIIKNAKPAGPGLPAIVIKAHPSVTVSEPDISNKLTAPAAPTTQTVVEQDAEPQTKKPDVPEAHLKAWFEFYSKIGGAMRDDPAWAHARMCFPNHSITRQRIRDLLPERPMGRPKTRGT